MANGLVSTNSSLAQNPSQPNLGSQARTASVPRPPHAILTNGSTSSNSQGVPHAPMQAAHMQVPPRIPPQMSSSDIRIFQEVNRVQAEQQRYLQQQQRQQLHPQANGHISPNMSSLSTGSQANPSNLTSLQGRSSSPSMNGVSVSAGSLSSPHMANPAQPQTLSSGMMPAVNQIASQIKARNPQASPEQISQMTTDRLNQYRIGHAQAQAAMQAAAGNGASTLSNNVQIPPQPSHPNSMANGSPMNSHQYTQMLMSQQSSQPSRNGAGSSGPRPASRSATPQIHRPPSAQGHQASASPRPSQVPIAGGQ